MSKKTFFLLTIIIVFGAFLRFYGYNENLYITHESFYLSTDIAMAFLIADRILNLGHLLLVGPTTSLYQVNILAPTYYYIITILFAILKSESAVTLIFTFIGIASIFLIFLLGRLLFGIRSGLIASFLYALSFTMVAYSRHIWEPHLVPFFVLVSLYLIVLADRKNNVILLFLALICYFISLMYISAYLLLPAFLYLFYNQQRKLNNSPVKSIFRSIFSFSFLFLILYLPVFIYEIRNNFPSLQYLINVLMGDTGYFSYDFSNYFTTISTNFMLLVKSTFGTLNFYTFLYFTSLLAVFLPLLIKIVLSDRNLLTLYVFFTAALALSGFYQQNLEAHRLAALYPIFFLMISRILDRLFFHKKSNYQIVSLLLGVILILHFLSINSSIYINNIVLKEKSFHKNLSKNPFSVARYLLSSAGNDSFSFYTITPRSNTNYYSTLYYYALEKLTNKKFASLNYSGNWIEDQINWRSKWIYLICQDFDFDDKNSDEKCLGYFSNRYRLDKPEVVKWDGSIMIYKFRSPY